MVSSSATANERMLSNASLADSMYHLLAFNQSEGPTYSISLKITRFFI